SKDSAPPLQRSLPSGRRENILLPVNPSAGAAVEPSASDHPIRVRLLHAAPRVFARQGYEGTKIMDIVRESGLSTGAVYGRFRSKTALLREAVIRPPSFNVGALDDGERVADMLQRSASRFDAPLTLDE